jgi:endonuclease/exonuclease/phosphatase family metal-dependent hydrolase
MRFNKQENSAEGTFKVLSYNVRLFNAYEKDNNDTESKILDYIREQEADIVCLQEMFSNNERGMGGSRVLSSINNRYYSHTKFIGSDNKRFYGIGTYSKYKIINKGDIYHPNSSSLTIFSDIVIDQDTFRIFNNHLQSFKLKSMERSFIEDIMSLDEKESINGVKELSLNLRNGFLQRSGQADIVKEAINNSPYPVIVLGDFNDTPISYTYHKLRKGLNDSFVESGYGAGFTYKGFYPNNRIDFILFSDKLESNYFDVLKIRYSDHYPVISYFSITE